MPKVKAIIDSGAYTAWRAGGEVNLPAYCAWLKAHDAWATYYVNLDVINPQDSEAAAAAGWKNYEYMRSEGLDPIPVFHAGEDFKWLKRMLDSGCSYIGLAASAMTRKNERDAWYALAWAHLVDRDGNPVVKVHAFGEGRPLSLIRFPWTSSDTATWLYSAQRTARITLPGGGQVSHRHDRGSTKAGADVDSLEGLEQEALHKALARLRLAPSALTDRRAEGTFMRSLITAAAYAEYQIRVRAERVSRYRPSGFFSAPSSHRHAIELPPFSLYLVSGNNEASYPAIAIVGHQHVLSSFAYLQGAPPAGLSSRHVDLPSWCHDPEGVSATAPLLKRWWNLYQQHTS